MNSELLDACIAAVQRADGPLTAARIGSLARGRQQSAKMNAELAEELGKLPENSGVSEWPRYGRSRIFWKRPFRNSVEDAFLDSLAAEALTVSSAAGPVRKMLQRVSEARVLGELRTAAPRLAAAGRILQIAVNRQAVVYLSFTFLERLIPARASTVPMADAILGVVARLQSAPGNYVRIDRLRNAPELRKPVDDAAIVLTEKGELVLARYDGPRPVPDNEKWNYIEDANGQLFIGVALRRDEPDRA